VAAEESTRQSEEYLGEEMLPWLHVPFALPREEQDQFAA
jgi:hypothetical protein